MNDVTSSANPMDEAWKAREEQALSRIDDGVKYFTKMERRNRYCARILAFTVLVCAILAPLTVASSGKNAPITLFGLSEPNVSRLALGVTMLLALSEGLRRTFRCEQRYGTCLVSLEELEYVRETYVDLQISKPIGSDAWVKNLNDLREKTRAYLRKDSEEFAQTIKGDTTKP